MGTSRFQSLRCNISALFVEFADHTDDFFSAIERRFDLVAFDKEMNCTYT